MAMASVWSVLPQETWLSSVGICLGPQSGFLPMTGWVPWGVLVYGMSTAMVVTDDGFLHLYLLNETHQQESPMERYWSESALLSCTCVMSATGNSDQDMTLEVEWNFVPGKALNYWTCSPSKMIFKGSICGYHCFFKYVHGFYLLVDHVNIIAWKWVYGSWSFFQVHWTIENHMEITKLKNVVVWNIANSSICTQRKMFWTD